MAIVTMFSSKTFRSIKALKNQRLYLQKKQFHPLNFESAKCEEVKHLVIPVFEPWNREKPWPLQVNTHLEKARTESIEWMKTFEMEPNRLAYHISCNFFAFACWTLPAASWEQIRIYTDYAEWVFAMDDDFDLGLFKGNVLHLADIHFAEMKNFDKIPNFTNQWVKLFVEIINRLKRANMPPSQISRFISTCLEQVDNIKLQFVNRKNPPFDSLQDYLLHRRPLVGMTTTFPFIQWANNLIFQKDILRHPLIKLMEFSIIDAVSFTNDALSYLTEYVLGDVCNSVTVIQRLDKISTQDALDKVSYLAVEAMEDFDKLDAAVEKSNIKHEHWDAVHKYAHGLRIWLSGLIQWSCNYSSRYLNISKRKYISANKCGPSGYELRNVDEYLTKNYFKL